MNFPVATSARALSLFLLASIGCSGKKAATEPDELGVMRASINGVDFVGSSELFALHANGVLSIAARASDGRTIYITVLNTFDAKEVDIGPGSPNSGFTGLADTTWRSNLSGGKGKVILTEVGQGIARGTFTFTAVADRNTGARGVRNVSGRFNVEYLMSDATLFGRDAVQLASFAPASPRRLRATVSLN